MMNGKGEREADREGKRERRKEGELGANGSLA